MRLLTTTTSKIRFQSDASADLEASWSGIDSTTGPTFTAVGDVLVSVTDTTQTDWVPSPAASTVRNAKNLTLKNNHASQTAVVTVDHTDGTHTAEIAQFSLLAGEWFEYNDGIGWQHYDVNGNPYTTVGPVASQAEMEAGTSLVTFVTPGRFHFHPSTNKCWGEFLANSTTIETAYNITSVADTATGAMTVTIGTDFSSVDWACVPGGSEDDATLVYSTTYDAKAAGTVILRRSVEAGSGADPTSASGNASWSFMGAGDLA